MQNVEIYDFENLKFWIFFIVYKKKQKNIFFTPKS